MTASPPDARELVLVYGWNSTSYQILNFGMRHWFSAQADAVIGYVSCNGVRVVAGAPVCRKERLKEVLTEFEADAQTQGERVCYVCAELRLETIYDQSPTHAKVLLGAQPVWNPQNWGQIVAANKSLRAQLNRARNKQVKVSRLASERAHNHPELKNCLHEWLARKGLPPLHFMVEPETLGNLHDRRVYIAECAGKIVGFVILSPIAGRHGWLFEQFVHRPDSPNGTVELMIDAAMRELAADGYSYATLGLSPLSQRAEVRPFKNPLWLRLFLAWMRKHGSRFYNFDGLDAFKAKLRPENWEPVFAIYNQPRVTPRPLCAIAAAFSRNAPVSFFLSGLQKAFFTEIRWLKQKMNKNRN